VVIHRHLLALASVDPRPQALLAAMSLCLLLEGADECGDSSAPFGARIYGPPSAGPSGGYVSVPTFRRCRRKWWFIGTFRRLELWGL